MSIPTDRQLNAKTIADCTTILVVESSCNGCRGRSKSCKQNSPGEVTPWSQDL